MARPGIYRHYKGGFYEVVDTAEMDGSRESMVIYRPLYVIAGHFGHLTVRKTSEFHEKVSLHIDTDSPGVDREVPRFEWVANTPWRNHQPWNEWVPSGSDV